MLVSTTSSPIFLEEPKELSLASWKGVAGIQKNSFPFVVVVKKLAGRHCATSIGGKPGFQSALAAVSRA